MARHNQLTTEQLTTTKRMLSIRQGLRLRAAEFSLLLAINEGRIRTREAFRTAWKGNPLRDFRRQILVEVGRVEDGLRQVRAILAEENRDNLNRNES